MSPQFGSSSLNATSIYIANSAATPSTSTTITTLPEQVAPELSLDELKRIFGYRNSSATLNTIALERGWTDDQKVAVILYLSQLPKETMIKLNMNPSSESSSYLAAMPEGLRLVIPSETASFIDHTPDLRGLFAVANEGHLSDVGMAAVSAKLGKNFTVADLLKLRSAQRSLAAIPVRPLVVPVISSDDRSAINAAPSIFNPLIFLATARGWTDEQMYSLYLKLAAETLGPCLPGAFTFEQVIRNRGY